MDKSPISAEGIFAEAMEILPGDARERLLAERCGEDAALRREVASLLRAHEDAGDFLEPSPRPAVRAEPPVTSSQGTAVLNAAAHADAFMRGFSQPDAGQVEKFVAQLPRSEERRVGPACRSRS